MTGYYDLPRSTLPTSSYVAGQPLTADQLNTDSALLSDLYSKWTIYPNPSALLCAEKNGGDISLFEPLGNSTTVTQRGCAYTQTGATAVNVANTNAQTLRRRILFRTPAAIGGQSGMIYPAVQYDPQYYTELHAIISDTTTTLASTRIWIGFTTQVSLLPNTSMSIIATSCAAITADFGQTNLFVKQLDNSGATWSAYDTGCPRGALNTGVYIRIILDSYNKRGVYTCRDLNAGVNYTYTNYEYYPNALMIPRVAITTNTAAACDIGVAFCAVIRPGQDQPVGAPVLL
jgi:hypothetical protein